MRFDEAESLMRELPDRLPPPPRDLMPVALATADGSPPGMPRWPDVSRKTAAVLILIFPDGDGEANLILTERSPGEHRHAGQISLPGGGVEDDDASIEAAALREAYEEIGLNPDEPGMRIKGVLPEMDVRVSGFMVHPVVAFADHEPALSPDGYEVAAIFSAPLAAFLPDAPIEIVTAERDGYRLRYGGYRIGPRHVWGATAMLLGRFGVWLASVRERQQ
jgi:8-oxo-dGTP pyrophosphatase MutT (NUDIX family)